MSLSEDLIVEYMREGELFVFDGWGKIDRIEVRSGTVNFREYMANCHDESLHSICLLDLMAWVFFKNKEDT